MEDRTLAITVTATSNWFSPGNLGANITYSQTGSNPNMPNVVKRNTGNIDLRHMPKNSKFTDNVDITLTLDDQITDESGNSLAARWAYADEGTPPSQGFCWFTVSETDPTIITIPGMSTARMSETSILIDDSTPDSATPYTFRMGLVVPSLNDYYITIDPVIVGKGVDQILAMDEKLKA
jgi:hypothetical protein